MSTDDKDGCLGHLFNYIFLLILCLILQGIGWLIKKMGGFGTMVSFVLAVTGKVIGWIALLFFLIAGVSLVFKSIFEAKERAGERIISALSGLLLLVPAWAVSFYWLRFSAMAPLRLLQLLEPHQWLTTVGAVLGPMVCYMIISCLPLSWFEPEYSLAGKECGSCGSPVPLGARVGDKCPRCGVHWSFERSRKDFDPERARRTCAFVLSAIALFVTLIILYNCW